MTPAVQAELAFLRGGSAAAADAATPAAALEAATRVANAAAVGGATSRASPYTALLRSLIAMVAENQVGVGVGVGGLSQSHYNSKWLQVHTASNAG